MSDEARLKALATFGVLDTPPEPGFDDAVAMAREICAAPIALVSLVDSDRQWFKAKLGFDETETDLNRSVCRFVVEERATVIIPDLAADPRTADNPLVTHEPHVRFYAGAPLTTKKGEVLGALCVLDTAPRPAGLTEAQQRHLETLARQVVDLLELRLALSQRDQALAERESVAERARLTETRWRELFDRINEGFIFGCLVRDVDGKVQDWRYEEVNRAWGALVGVAPADAIGRSARELFPAIEDEWIDEPARAVETGTPVRFTRDVGMLGRSYDGFVQPAGGDCFTILFVEVTDRVATTRRNEALLHVGDALRDCGTAEKMTCTAAAIVGTTLGAARTSFGRVDTATQTVDIDPNWTAPGVAEISGRFRFEDFGRIRDELARAEPLVIEDVEVDLRTAGDPGPLRALGIGALVNMPVRERGRTVAVFIVHSSEPRKWTADELAFIRNVADRLEVGLARLRAEQRQAVLNREIGHRLKNSLTMAQAIANQTLRRSTDPAALRAYNARLQALGRAHDVLIRRDLSGGDLQDTIDTVLDLAGVAGRYRAKGPTVLLGANTVLSASLLFHELATNAQKYGALSSTGGRLEVDWAIADDVLTLHWRELGGPPALAPTTKGFGSTLLKLGLVGTGGSTIDYGPLGLSAVFTAPMERVG